MHELPRTGFEKYTNNAVEKFFYGRIPLQHAFSWLYFNKGSLVQHIIHQFKYRDNKALGIYAGQLMGEAMQQNHWHQQVDAVVPLPLNKKKLLKRGYNQAALLSEGLAAVLNKPVEAVAVVRTKFTETQTRKTRMQRWNNVEDVFDLEDTHSLQNKHVLLVDDVVTTGATLEACGQKLLQVPGLTLSVATLAVALRI